MAEKKKQSKSKLEIQTRKPEKRGIFDNVGANRTKDTHPLREILNFPVPGENAGDETSNNLPSTSGNASRPQLENFAVHTIQQFAVHNLDELPSTNAVSGRPQILELPSTKYTVDVLPSTGDVLPSTNHDENADFDGKTSTAKKDAVHKPNKPPSTKGDRHNKFLARYDNRVDSQIKKKIDIFCAKFDLSQREFAEQSAVHFIDVWTAKFEKNVDGKTAHDDRGKMIMWKSKPILINLYRLYNSESKWKFKDDEAAAKYSDVDLRLIELGIIETLFNSNFKKINSFLYFQNEIDNFIGQKLGEEMLVFLIEHYRKKFLTATKRDLDYKILNTE